MELNMGMKNTTGVRKVVRGGKAHWVIDFRYVTKVGQRLRFRRDASVQMHTPALAEAKRLMARAAETGSMEDYEATRSATLTFGEFARGPFEVMFMPGFRPATQVRYRALLRQSLLAFFGGKRLDAITPQDIRAFAATLNERRVQTKGPLGLVRTLLRTAHEGGHLDAVPPFPSGLVRTSRKLPDAPSPADFERMLEQASGWMRVAIALSGFAGMRMGEVRGLEVRDIDFDGHRILLRRSLSEDVSVTPKSGHDRMVPLVPELEAMLRDAVRSKLPRARAVLDDEGQTPGRQVFLHRFKRVLRLASLQDRPFHSLRHYFITELVRRGAGLEAVRMLAGHSKLEMTQRYAHATAEDLKAAIAKLGR
jgi:integrase